jgi:hypothetical protein
MGDGLRTLEDRTFLLLIVAVSVAFASVSTVRRGV